MKKKFLLAGVLAFNVGYLTAQVGINTSSPIATLDIRTVDATSGAKNIRIVNSNNVETLSVSNTGITAIGDNITQNANARLIIQSSGNESTLRLINLPITTDLKNTPKSSVTYRSLAPLYVDQNGHMVKGISAGTNSTGTTFDGTYTLPADGSLIPIIPLTKANSLVTFKVTSGLVFGINGVGANILMQVSFGYNTGFKLVDFASSSGDTGALNIPTVNVTNNLSSNPTPDSLTSNILVDFSNGSDLELVVRNNAIFARSINASKDIVVTIFDSNKIR